MPFEMPGMGNDTGVGADEAKMFLLKKYPFATKEDVEEITQYLSENGFLDGPLNENLLENVVYQYWTKRTSPSNVNNSLKDINYGDKFPGTVYDNYSSTQVTDAMNDTLTKWHNTEDPSEKDLLLKELNRLQRLYLRGARHNKMVRIGSKFYPDKPVDVVLGDVRDIRFNERLTSAVKMAMRKVSQGSRVPEAYNAAAKLYSLPVDIIAKQCYLYSTRVIKVDYPFLTKRAY